MTTLHTYNHPLIQCELTLLRDQHTSSAEFRGALHRLTRYLAYEAARQHPTRPLTVTTPMEEPYDGAVREDRHVVLAPILRAGLCMTEGALEVFTGAQIHHVGLYRNEETLQPVTYYNKLPDTFSAETVVYVLDPMLATGGSAIAAIDLLKDKSITALHFLCLIAAPEGVEALQKAHPEVHIHTTAVDQRLNEQGYIVPGLGDAGDRAFNTLRD